MADCVTYQGIKTGTCKFTPEGGSASTLNLVTSISVSPSVSLGQIKGDDDLYPRCQYVISGASSGSITSTDIEAVDSAITVGVAGTLLNPPPPIACLSRVAVLGTMVLLILSPGHLPPLHNENILLPIY